MPFIGVCLSISLTLAGIAEYIEKKQRTSLRDLTKIGQMANNIREGKATPDTLRTLLLLTSKYRDWFPVHTSYDPLKRNFVEDYAYRVTWFRECIQNYGCRKGRKMIADAVRNLEDDEP